MTFMPVSIFIIHDSTKLYLSIILRSLFTFNIKEIQYQSISVSVLVL